MSYRFAGAYFEEQSQGIYYAMDTQGVYTIKYILHVNLNKFLLVGFVFGADGEMLYNTHVEGTNEQQVYVQCKENVTEWLASHSGEYTVNDIDEDEE